MKGYLARTWRDPNQPCQFLEVSGPEGVVLEAIPDDLSRELTSAALSELMTMTMERSFLQLTGMFHGLGGAAYWMSRQRKAQSPVLQQEAGS